MSISLIKPQIPNETRLRHDTLNRDFKLPGDYLLKLNKYNFIRQGSCRLGAQFTKQPGKLLNGYRFPGALVGNRNTEVPFSFQKQLNSV
jgi:hypothetical protein